MENWLCPITPLLKIQNIKYNHYVLKHSYAMPLAHKKLVLKTTAHCCSLVDPHSDSISSVRQCYVMSTDLQLLHHQVIFTKT